MKAGALIKTIFFGNYFYGLCAVMLSIEASLQQRFPLNDAGYYIAVFLLTVLYYTKAYMNSGTGTSSNPRTQWYIDHRKTVITSQWIIIIICGIAGVYFLYHHANDIRRIGFMDAALLVIFPIVGALYYGIDRNVFSGYNLRSIGWLKPFLIGFVWGGMVTVYPIVYYNVTHRLTFEPTVIGSLLFLKNFMFVTVLGIMFDIKDYADDSNQQLKTFVVRTGLRKTIFYIIIPLSVLGLGTFLTYAGTHGFSAGKILINCIPFILMIAVAWSLYRRKSILFYLVIIDGLMLVKGICGTIAMTFF